MNQVLSGDDQASGSGNNEEVSYFINVFGEV